MKYLPILQELFESDSFIFMLIGLILAVIIAVKMKESKKIMIGFGSSFVLYAVCELVSNIRTNFLVELILLFVGTVAIGGILGFLTGIVVMKVRKR